MLILYNGLPVPIQPRLVLKEILCSSACRSFLQQVDLFNPLSEQDVKIVDS